MKLRPSPATVIAVIALVISLTGTAFAAGVFTKKQKKQVTALATKTFNKLIPGASVKYAASAGTAERAETAAKADTAGKAAEATVAGKATEATRATEATTAKRAIEATTAQRATLADRATEADSATTADRATSAANADRLGGVAAAGFQRPLQNGCPDFSSINSITAQGVAGCTTPVRAIRLGPLDGSEQQVDLGNGLVLIANCRANPSIRFQNALQEAVNINFLFLKSATVSSADGERLQPGAVHTDTVTERLEGQYTWLTSRGVTTINIHAFNGNGFCEVTGTALTSVG